MLELVGPATHGEFPVASRSLSGQPYLEPIPVPRAAASSSALVFQDREQALPGPAFPPLVQSLNGSFLGSNDTWILKTAR